MSVIAKFAAAFSLVSGTVMPSTSAIVTPLLTRGSPNCVRAAVRDVEVHLVRVHRQQGHPDVVRLGDGSPQTAPIDVADVDVLVEPTAPLLRSPSRCFPLRFHPHLRTRQVPC